MKQIFSVAVVFVLYCSVDAQQDGGSRPGNLPPALKDIITNAMPDFEPVREGDSFVLPANIDEVSAAIFEY